MTHVLITGAASGIGKAIASAYAGIATRVTIADRDAARLEEVAVNLRESGVEVTAVALDLRDAHAADELIAQAWQIAPIDILVCSAGVYPATPFLAIDADVWDHVLDLNTRAPLLLTVALARLAIEAGRPANVVTISSGAALRARPGAAPYSTSKAAVEAAMRAAALELGPYSIRVNCVAPGFVTVDSAANPVTPEYADAVGQTPLGRRGLPVDIANAVIWIASDQAGWVTGTVLRVDGGSSAGAMNLPQHWESLQLDKEGGQ